MFAVSLERLHAGSRVYLGQILEAIALVTLADLVRPSILPANADAFALHFVRGQVDRMPKHLRLALLGVATLFDFGAVIAEGRPFREIDLAARRRYVEGVRRSRLGPMRDVVRFVEQLTAFALYSCAKWE